LRTNRNKNNKGRRKIRAKAAVEQGVFKGRCVDAGNITIRNRSAGIDFTVSGNSIDAHSVYRIITGKPSGISESGPGNGWELLGSWLNDEEIGDVTDLMYYVTN